MIKLLMGYQSRSKEASKLLLRVDISFLVFSYLPLFLLFLINLLKDTNDSDKRQLLSENSFQKSYPYMPGNKAQHVKNQYSNNPA